MFKPPYLLVGFDVEISNPKASVIIADVLAGFPQDARPSETTVEHLYCIEVPSHLAKKRFMEIGMYLSVQDAKHGGVVRWVLQLCRIDEVAVG